MGCPQQMFTLFGAPFAAPQPRRAGQQQQQQQGTNANGSSADTHGAEARPGPSAGAPRTTNIRVVRTGGRNPYMEG
jgi:hypothetical protein